VLVGQDSGKTVLFSPQWISLNRGDSRVCASPLVLGWMTRLWCKSLTMLLPLSEPSP